MARKYLTDIEYQKFRDYLYDPDNWSPENTLVELLILTGMRQGELVRLRPEDFYFHPDYTEITIRSLKGSNERTARLHKDFGKRLKSLVSAMKEARCPVMGLLVSASMNPKHQTRNIQLIVHRIYKELFGEGHGLTVHSLRHTYSRIAFDVFNQDIYMVRKAMGHKFVTTTQRYATHKEEEDVSSRMMTAMTATRTRQGVE